jgi:hypothetical protein
MLSLTPYFISPLLSFHQAKLLVLCLAAPRPFRGHVDPVLLFLITLFLRLVHSCWLMLGRAVHSIQNERRGPGVDELMLRASWYDDQIPRLDVLVLASYSCFALPRCEG